MSFPNCNWHDTNSGLDAEAEIAHMTTTLRSALASAYLLKIPRPVCQKAANGMLTQH